MYLIKRNVHARFTKVTHCIFDLDGTILDSETTYHDVLAIICSKYEKKYTKELRLELTGKTSKEVCETIVRELKIPLSVREFEDQLKLKLKRVLPHSRVQEGVLALLNHLRDNRIPMALATNSTDQEVGIHENSIPELFKFFHHKVTFSDPEVKQGKPQPDIYLVAAARFPDRPEPIKCLAFEDTDTGVSAAKEAGMQVVMIPTLVLPEKHLRKATLVISSLLHFKPELFGLPPFKSKPEEKGSKRG